MKKTLLKRILQFLFLVTVLLSTSNTFAQPGGYAFRLESNSNFGTAYVLANNSPTTGILSTTVQAASTADNYLIEWDGFANKWSNTSTPKNSELTFNWGGGSFNGPDGILNGNFQNGKYYTLQIRGLSYSNRQGVMMETDNVPQSFHGTASTAVSTPSNVCSGTAVTITVTLAGPKSPQERVFVRYAINGNFGSSSVVEALGSGTTWTSANATIPAVSNAAGATINYYAYTTTVNANSSSDHDLITLRFGNNGGSNYSYTVLTSVTYYTDADGDGFGDPLAPVSSCTGAPTVSGHLAVLNSSDCDDAVTYYTDADSDGFGALPLLACGTVTNNSDCNDNQLQYLDSDGDGFGSTTPVACGVDNSSDCNDNQIQYLDADADGFGSTIQVACGVLNSNDCNDNQFQYLDADGDGFGSTTPVACGVTNSNDCNDNQIQYLDADADGFGSVTQVACGVVNNSDCNDNQFQYLDADGDGFGSTTPVACGVTNSSDCNDNQIQYLDADGDTFGSTTQVACGVVNSSDCNDNQFQYLDADGDGFGSTTPVACGVTNSNDCNDNQIQYLDADADGFGSLIQVACGVTNSSDCNDNQFQYLDADGDGFGSTTPVACGVTNTNDCNDNQIQYLDADNDSFGSTIQVACGVTNSSDCNDNQFQYLDADGDGFGSNNLVACGVLNNSDCNDNQIQYLDADNDSFGSTIQVACGVTNSSDCNDNQFQYLDADGDGFGSNNLVACGVTNNSDCNDNQIQYLDADNDSFGSTIQVACGVTNSIDCNDNQFQYLDADGDGFGSNNLVACGVTNNSDCNDNQIQYLDADNDSFGSTTQVACGVVNSSDCNDNQFQYLDADGDGFGSNNLVACGVTNNSDCNDNQIQYLDADNDSFGSTTQVACGVVNSSDCNDNQFQYLDADGDGFGSNNLVACGVLNNGDCNDNQLLYLDNDGDGLGSMTFVGCGGVTNNSDCNDNDILNLGGNTYYQDFDGDGFGNASVTQMTCAQPIGYVTNNSDCNDNQIQYLDADSDGYGGTTQVACGVTNNADCNDNNTTVHPGAVDVCGDGIDNDCNGVIDNVGQAGGCIPTVNSFTIGASCGSMVSSLSVTIIAAIVPGATTYTFRITNMVTNAFFVVNRPVNSFALSNYAGITLGTQYQVQVSVNGGATYGPPCIVYTPAPTSTIGAQCGTTLSSMTQFVYATYAPSVTGYRFRVKKVSTGSFYVHTSLSAQNRFSFSQLPADFVSFGTTYSVEVALRNTDGTYLPYGAACTITTPVFPTSEVVLSQCDYTATSSTQNIAAVVVAGATDYRFQLTNASLSYTFSVDRTLNSFSLSLFPSLVAGTTYTVRVAVRIGGVWGPLTGKPCNITTPGTAPGGEKVVDVAADFKAVAYPNPFADNFMFDVTTTTESNIQVRVYDMLGKQVEKRNVNVSEINNIAIGENYPSGVYNVIVSQGENSQSIRVIKR